MVNKNYITPLGAQKLKEELRQLRDKERPEVVKVVSWAAENGDRSENADYIYGKRRLREIDRRIEFLVRRLSEVEIVDPGQLNGPEIFFGATVEVECNRQDMTQIKIYSIVGEDEIDTTKGRISWRSPLSQALLRKKEGDVVTVSTPRGDEEYCIRKVSYRNLE